MEMSMRPAIFFFFFLRGVSRYQMVMLHSVDYLVSFQAMRLRGVRFLGVITAFFTEYGCGALEASAVTCTKREGETEDLIRCYC